MRRYDGMMLGSGHLQNPFVYEIYDPRWYRIDRWIRWWIGKRTRSVGSVVIDGRCLKTLCCVRTNAKTR